MTNDELIERMAETVHDTDAVGDFPSHEAWCKGLAKAALTVAQAEYLPVIEKAMQRIEEALPYVSDSHARATLHMMKAELAAPLLGGSDDH